MSTFRLPNLHRSSNVLLALILGQILCSIVWLLESTALSLHDYGLYSFYAQAVALLACLVFGMLRQVIAKMTAMAGVVVFLATFSSCFLIVELMAHLLISGPSEFNLNALARLVFATLLLGIIFARGLFLLQILEDRNTAELQLKVDVLQARINPHFLFNSLNSISELTATKPKLAEDAIQSLAMLFRVSLESRETQHSLKEELNLCKRYISLESVRFDGGVNFVMDANIAQSENWLVPKLILQPLLENSVKYGVVNQLEVPIRLSVSETAKDISIRLVNKVAEDSHNKQGNGIAVQNIKDRLFVLYEGRYTFSYRTVDDVYYVFIQLPKVGVKVGVKVGAERLQV